MFNYTAFEGFQIFATGPMEMVAMAVRKRQKTNRDAQILIFSDSTGKQMDFDLSGTEKDVLERLKIYSIKQSTPNTGAGRPKLGVIPREISLLPNHWEWLTNQPGGASSTIRQLLDEKIKSSTIGKDKIKTSQEVTYKFLTAIAGDLPHFEEAIRFLYRKDKKKFLEQISGWPKDLVNHALVLASGVFQEDKE